MTIATRLVNCGESCIDRIYRRLVIGMLGSGVLKLRVLGGSRVRGKLLAAMQRMGRCEQRLKTGAMMRSPRS